MALIDGWNEPLTVQWQILQSRFALILMRLDFTIVRHSNLLIIEILNESVQETMLCLKQTYFILSSNRLNKLLTPS